MKIAHIVSTYPPYYGGMGNVVFETASALAARGHDVTVLTPDVYEQKEIKPPSVPAAKTHAPELSERIDYAERLKPSLSYGNAARLPQVKEMLDEFDIVHLHYPFFGTANLVRRWKMRHPDKPLVITYHMDTRAPGWKGLIFALYARHWLPKILTTADRLIVSSFDYLESSQAAGIYRRQKGKWAELPFGVDTERFQPRPKPSKLINDLNLDLNLPTILFVGGMDRAHYFKGIKVFLQALFFVKQQGIKFQAIFVGDGELKKSYQDLSVAYRLSSVTRFVGYVSNEALSSYYNLADLFVLPSINRGEAFGMVLLEAMSSGVPVIATDLPGVRTVVADGGVVVLPDNRTELAEAIIGFFSKPIDKSAWSARVRSAVEEKAAWPRIAERLEVVYNELADK